MRRAATSAFLAGWIGFLAVSGLTASLAVLKIAGIESPEVPGLTALVARFAERLLTGGNAFILVAVFVALLEFMIAALLGLAFWLVHKTEADDQTAGERLAVVGLACVGVLVLAVDLGGFAFFADVGTLAGIETVLGLSVLAVAFDRLIAVDEEEVEDDAGFRMALTLIGQEMARDANLRRPVDDRPRMPGRDA